MDGSSSKQSYKDSYCLSGDSAANTKSTKEKTAFLGAFRYAAIPFCRNSSNIIHPIIEERLDRYLETPRFDTSHQKTAAEATSQPQLTITSLKELLKPTQDIDDLRLSASDEITQTLTTAHRDPLSQANQELQMCKREIDALRLQNRQLENTLMQIGERLSQEIKEKCDLVACIY